MPYIQAEILLVVKTDDEDVSALSQLAARIVRQHFDPLIGSEQNTYMIAKFQTPEAIRRQMDEGSRYYWVKVKGQPAGFLAFYPRDGKLYLSKFYLAQEWRGKHLARQMHRFVCDAARKEQLPAVFLNVNRHNTEVISIYEHLGFQKLREEKNDIGNGFYMDDYVLEYRI